MEGLTTARYMRKPFEIEAVRVTAENIELVAKWCGGELRTRERSRNQFIWVEVENARTDRQKTAYVGDWVMYANKGFKVYTNIAFESSFVVKDEARAINYGPGMTRLVVDLDVIEPSLQLIKGGMSTNFDLVDLFMGQISYETVEDGTQRVG